MADKAFPFSGRGEQIHRRDEVAVEFRTLSSASQWCRSFFLALIQSTSGTINKSAFRMTSMLRGHGSRSLPNGKTTSGPREYPRLICFSNTTTNQTCPSDDNHYLSPTGRRKLARHQHARTTSGGSTRILDHGRRQV
ncbi:hypothetical protein AKJ16_DCAP02588 [Drosera capensis]